MRSWSGSVVIAGPGNCREATWGVMVLKEGQTKSEKKAKVELYPLAVKYDLSTFGFPVRAKEAHMSWMALV